MLISKAPNTKMNRGFVFIKFAYNFFLTIIGIQFGYNTNMN